MPVAPCRVNAPGLLRTPARVNVPGLLRSVVLVVSVAPGFPRTYARTLSASTARTYVRTCESTYVRTYKLYQGCQLRRVAHVRTYVRTCVCTYVRTYVRNTSRGTCLRRFCHRIGSGTVSARQGEGVPSPGDSGSARRQRRIRFALPKNRACVCVFALHAGQFTSFWARAYVRTT